MKRKILFPVCVLVFLIALGIALYPVMANLINEKFSSELECSYNEEMEQTEQRILDEAWAAAEQYNESLLPVRYTKKGLEQASLLYSDILNLSKDGIMGYVEIPKIDIHLPIYHTTEAEVLEKGVGHLMGSSVPIGGQGNHSVLTAHTGVAGKRLFSDLVLLEEGDVFYIHVLDRKIAYRVCSISVVLPEETELLESENGQDYCTLVTCTPYGVNTHRLLVRGSRITLEEAETVEAQTQPVRIMTTWKKNYLKGILMGLGATALTVTGLLILMRRRKPCGKS